jgi:membrane fusion protein, multidrug efflux system
VPVTGYVAQRTVQVGQQVAPGTALMVVVPENQMWVQANFKETQLGSVRIGQPATVRSDFYKGAVTYNGRVVGIFSGTGDVFVQASNLRNVKTDITLASELWTGT